MTRAVVVYRSRTGITRRYGEGIAEHLRGRGIDVSVLSVGDCDPATLADCDYLFLGCWTSGLFVIAQRPDGPWLSFVRDLSRLERPRVALFTTYKLVTGSMFPKMRERLAGKTREPELELKSRDGSLSQSDIRKIDAFVG